MDIERFRLILCDLYLCEADAETVGKYSISKKERAEYRYRRNAVNEIFMFVRDELGADAETVSDDGDYLCAVYEFLEKISEYRYNHRMFDVMYDVTLDVIDVLEAMCGKL